MVQICTPMLDDKETIYDMDELLYIQVLLE